ncbi:MAG: hypothetical protein Q8Q49_02470 [bacterium]|nr:hypothetical protein [bacterium]
MKTTVASLTDQVQTDFLSAFVKKIIQSGLFQFVAGQFQKVSPSSFSARSSMQRFKKNFNRKYLYLLPVFITGIIIVVGIGSFLGKQDGAVKGVQDQRVAINKPLAVEELNKTYTYIVDKSAPKEIKIKFTIQSCELRDQIVVKGQPAVAVKGRVFFVCNLKLVNDSTTPVAMQTRDYMRLIVDGSPDKLAPDIHNDPVQIQAISSKYSRLGFAIDDSFKKLVLQVGEISGKKEQIELHLQ